MKYRVSILLEPRDPRATQEDIESLIHDLSWVGGCRHPDDPAFESLEVLEVEVKRCES